MEEHQDLQNISYEEYSALDIMLYAYEKIGGNVLIFYRDYLNKTKNKLNKKSIW